MSPGSQNWNVLRGPADQTCGVSATEHDHGCISPLREFDAEGSEGFGLSIGSLETQHDEITGLDLLHDGRSNVITRDHVNGVARRDFDGNPPFQATFDRADLSGIGTGGHHAQEMDVDIILPGERCEQSCPKLIVIALTSDRHKDASDLPEFPFRWRP